MTTQMSRSTASERSLVNGEMTFSELAKYLAEQDIAMCPGRIVGGLVRQPLRDLVRAKTVHGLGASTVEAVNDALEKLHEERKRELN